MGVLWKCLQHTCISDMSDGQPKKQRGIEITKHGYLLCFVLIFVLKEDACVCVCLCWWKAYLETKEKIEKNHSSYGQRKRNCLANEN